MRILIAKLHEAYRVFNQSVQGDAASLLSAGGLDPERSRHGGTLAA
jgi:hypothetical protein